jgi:hypothetical protein
LSKDRVERVEQAIAQFPALVDGSGGFRRSVAGDPARERKLPEQPPDSLLVLRDV